MSYWDLVEPIWDEVSIYDGPEAFLEQFSAHGEAASLLLAAHWCQSEVCNGGFFQFFGNSAGVLAPEAVRAFRKLDMPQTAKVVEEAMFLLGADYPRERIQRGLALASIKVSYGAAGEPFLNFDNEFFDLIARENGGFEAAATAYGVANG
jgi:hypothetical protein